MRIREGALAILAGSSILLTSCKVRYVDAEGIRPVYKKEVVEPNIPYRMQLDYVTINEKYKIN